MAACRRPELPRVSEKDPLARALPCLALHCLELFRGRCEAATAKKVPLSFGKDTRTKDARLAANCSGQPPQSTKHRALMCGWQAAGVRQVRELVENWWESWRESWREAAHWPVPQTASHSLSHAARAP